ncbi:hypothetical protein [Kytococcus sedentarius]|uniref:hypothetical protein n=1 Tax=Kytococcus sedentarius TaxID=1276 RepID=UPI0035BC311E
MRTTHRPATRLAIATALAGGVLAAGPAAQAEPAAQETPRPEVTLEVSPDETGEGHDWTVTFTGPHLQPADGDPHVEWVVDTWAPDSGPWPTTVGSAAIADPRCEAGTERHEQDQLSANRTDHEIRPMPVGTDRVMVYGSYCAVDGTVHRFEMESDLLTGKDGQPVVESYPLEDTPVDEEDPRSDNPGPIIDTGREATGAGAASGALAAGLAGLGLLGIGAGLVARGRVRRAS